MTMTTQQPFPDGVPVYVVSSNLSELDELRTLLSGLPVTFRHITQPYQLDQLPATCAVFGSQVHEYLRAELADMATSTRTVAPTYSLTAWVRHQRAAGRL